MIALLLSFWFVRTLHMRTHNCTLPRRNNNKQIFVV